MIFGDMKFKQRPRDEQAEADGTAEAEKVRSILNTGFCIIKCNSKDFIFRKKTWFEVGYRK